MGLGIDWFQSLDTRNKTEEGPSVLFSLWLQASFSRREKQENHQLSWWLPRLGAFISFSWYNLFVQVRQRRKRKWLKPVAVYYIPNGCANIISSLLPKYRRKTILYKIRRDLIENFRHLCQYKGVEITEEQMCQIMFTYLSWSLQNFRVLISRDIW